MSERVSWHFLKLLAALALACAAQAAGDDSLVVRGLTGKPGGKLAYAQRSGPKTLNPVAPTDAPSREVIQRMTGDLIHINRETQKTEPALAKSWTVSADGLRYVLDLRRGVRFSDGHPFDADDVTFSFQVYLDDKVNAPQRDLLVLHGKPVTVRKLSPYRVEFDLPEPYAVAERLFDGMAILPRHLLEGAYKQGKIDSVWGLNVSPSEIAGLGPFRLKECAPGQRLTLERNPYYWKVDQAGNRLPYLSEVIFTIAGSENMQVLRFQSGESDMISRVSARDFAVLQKQQEQKGYALQALGPGLEYSFLFFNLNDLGANPPAQIAARQSFFRRTAFRKAVSLAVDRDAIVRLAYMGYAAPLAGPVPPGNKAWVNAKLPPPARSVARARDTLASDGFTWNREGALLDPVGQRVEFSIVTSAGNPERVQMATLIQDDLKQLGMDVHVVPLEFGSLLQRVRKTKDYEACLLSLSSPDADPNPDMPVWLSSGDMHLWNPEQPKPATQWEAEIDSLMRRQMVTLKYAERKGMFDRVQELAMEYLPIIPLVSPNILAGARKDLGNFRPALMDHYVLWNVDELYWK